MGGAGALADVALGVAEPEQAVSAASGRDGGDGQREAAREAGQAHRHLPEMAAASRGDPTVTTRRQTPA